MAPAHKHKSLLWSASDSSNSSREINLLKEKINKKLLEDPQNIKKAALLIETWINDAMRSVKKKQHK